MANGALHEVAGGGNDTLNVAAAALFSARIAVRTKGKVLWCIMRQDLFAPALVLVGLSVDRVIYAEAGDQKSLLACFEEGLRHGGLGAVIAKVAGLDMTTSRRLQLASEQSGSIGIAIRRWRRQHDTLDFRASTAAVTRWRVLEFVSSSAVDLILSTVYLCSSIRRTVTPVHVNLRGAAYAHRSFEGVETDKHTYCSAGTP